MNRMIVGRNDVILRLAEATAATDPRITIEVPISSSVVGEPVLGPRNRAERRAEKARKRG